MAQEIAIHCRPFVRMFGGMFAFSFRKYVDHVCGTTYERQHALALTYWKFVR